MVILAYRGYLALNTTEIANTSRAIAHLGSETPTIDFGYFDVPDGTYTVPADHPNITVDPVHPWIFTPGPGFDTTGMYEHPEAPGKFLLHWSPHLPVESVLHPGLGMMHESQTELYYGLGNPMIGSRIFGPGIFIHDQDWGSPVICGSCRSIIVYDDSWADQKEWLHDVDYRPELAPWYSSEIPQSGEFGGIIVTNIEGLDSTPVDVQITQAIGGGAVASPHRDASREVKVEALLFGCTNAGVEWGLKWLTNELRKTISVMDTRLRYLTASPAHSAADPDSLVREVHGVVYTDSTKVTERFNTGAKQHQQGTVYKIEWTMATLSPYAYLPAFDVDVEWDQVSRQPINWVHAADCTKPETCVDLPVLFSQECKPEEIEISINPPPVCGGCLPVNGIDKYRFNLPTMDYAFQGRETAVSLRIKNTGASPLTLQAFYRVCGSDIRCEDNRFPLQITGLPPTGELFLDGITGKFYLHYDERWRLPMGIVATPNGAPWRPALLDRQTCWDFIIQAAPDAEFAVSMQMADREP